MYEDKRYNNLLGEVKLQELDMGIAMRHLEVAAAAELGIGRFVEAPRSRPDPPRRASTLQDFLPADMIATFA